jgi:hypothetical protein
LQYIFIVGLKQYYLLLLLENRPNIIAIYC